MSTAASVAREFSAALDPALDGAGCPVEVYRLERLPPEAHLGAAEAVVCRVPGWRFDFAALEELHHQLEELRVEHESVQVQYSRTKEALVSLNASIEAAEAVEGPQRSKDKGGDSRQEVRQLRQQLAQSQKQQQDTKATVMALRNEFMHLVNMMSDAGHAKYVGAELPPVMRELDTNVKLGWPQESGRSPLFGMCDADRLADVCGGGVWSPVAGAHGGAGGGDLAKPTRHTSQPPAPGARRHAGSPRAYRSPATYATPRPGARPRGFHQRNVHSAGPVSLRHRVGEVY